MKSCDMSRDVASSPTRVPVPRMLCVRRAGRTWPTALVTMATSSSSCPCSTLGTSGASFPSFRSYARYSLHVCERRGWGGGELVVCSCAVQACSRVLLTGEVREKFLDALRRPSLSALARKSIAKQINEKARKVTKCPYCEAVNGECRACDLHVICL